MNKPIKNFKEGQVTLSVWQKDYNGKPIYSYSYQKSYKDKQGQWQNTTFLNKTDLKDLSFLIDTVIQQGIINKQQAPSQPQQQAPSQQQQMLQDTFQAVNTTPDPYQNDQNIPF